MSLAMLFLSAFVSPALATPLLLTPNSNRVFSSFQFDGNGFLYSPGQNANNSLDPMVLYRIPLAGGSPTQWTPTPSQNDYDVNPFLFTPDHSHIVYRVARSSSNGDLFSIPIGSGSPVQLTNTNLVTGGIYSTGFWLTPSGDRAIYLGRTPSTGRQELYSVPTDGSPAPIRLNGDLINSIGSADFVTLTPDGTNILYTALQENGHRDLYRVSPAGGASTRINTTVGVGSTIEAGYQMSNAGDFVVYGGGNRIYRKNVVGGTEVSLSPMLTATIDRFWVPPAGSRVLYTTDTNGDSRKELWSVPAAGGIATAFTGLLSNNPSVDYLNVLTGHRTNGTDMVAFRTSDSDGLSSFYVAPTDGGNATLLARLSTPGSYYPPYSMKFTDSGDYLILQNNSTRELYTYPTAGGAGHAFGPVFGYSLHPDGEHFIFAQEQYPTNERFFWARLDNATTAVDLTAGISPVVYAGMGITPDGRQLIYKTGTGSSTPQNFWSISLPANVPGDFNGDTVVDTADYVAWRKKFGNPYTQQDYETWRANFGVSAGSGSTANSVVSSASEVPEMNSVRLAAFAAALLVCFNGLRRG
jgi:hypothetical protein